MRILLCIKKFITDKNYRFCIKSSFKFYDHIPDKNYIEKVYFNKFDKKINLDSPETFNEKLQWLKLYDRKSEYTIMVDKYKVRNYISEKIGSQYLIPLIGVWDNPEDVDFDALPNQFVLKCNHNSGLGMYICKDKGNLDILSVKRNLHNGFKQNYYLTGREWPYKNVPHKIIAEKFMGDDKSSLTDYKIHCFNGKPRLILVCKDRFSHSGLTEDFFNEEWKHLDIKRPGCNNSMNKIEKPKELSEMLILSRILSENIPFLRTDFYIIDHKIYFSELTFFPASGFERFVPEKWDNILGSYLKLPITEQ